MKPILKAIVLTTSLLLCSAVLAETSANQAPPASFKEKMAKMAKTAVAGGGADKVWVNTKSNTYHCFGSKFYGKTATGSYMSEGDAKSKGAHPDHGKACKAA